MTAHEFPLQELDLGGQRHVSQAGSEPIHAGHELLSQVRSGGGLPLDSLAQVGGHPLPSTSCIRLRMVVVASPIIPTGSQALNRRKASGFCRRAGA